MVVTASVDKTVKVWDLRNMRQELGSLNGHSLAVRGVKCSPHMGSIVASCSYDMSVIVWDMHRVGQDPLRHRLEHHSEFVVGIN